MSTNAQRNVPKKSSTILPLTILLVRKKSNCSPSKGLKLQKSACIQPRYLKQASYPPSMCVSNIHVCVYKLSNVRVSLRNKIFELAHAIQHKSVHKMIIYCWSNSDMGEELRNVIFFYRFAVSVTFSTLYNGWLINTTILSEFKIVSVSVSLFAIRATCRMSSLNVWSKTIFLISTHWMIFDVT